MNFFEILFIMSRCNILQVPYRPGLNRDGNGAGLGRVHLDPDPDPFIYYRPKPAPDPLGLDFSDPNPLGLAGPWVLTGS